MGGVGLRAHGFDLVPQALAALGEMQGVRAEIAALATGHHADGHEPVHHFHGARPVDAEGPAECRLIAPLMQADVDRRRGARA